MRCSNLTNKYNPQEHTPEHTAERFGSNLTNKYNPQELNASLCHDGKVQILPINTILKNYKPLATYFSVVQILPINTILKNDPQQVCLLYHVQILPINTILKNC